MTNSVIFRYYLNDALNCFSCRSYYLYGRGRKMGSIESRRIWIAAAENQGWYALFRMAELEAS